MQIVKLSLGLIKYIKRELPKQKTPKEVVMFFKVILGAYLSELLRLYKRLFLFLDVEYQKQKKEYNRVQEVKKSLDMALKVLGYIDVKMVKEGKNRQQIRQFWADFVKTGQVREDIFKALLEDIHKIK